MLLIYLSGLSPAFSYFKAERSDRMANPIKRLDEMTGNYSNEFKQQRREAEAELFMYSALTTPPPTWLPMSAKTEWERIIPLLKSDFPISEADYTMLVSYVVLYARIKTCENEIRKTGTFVTNETTGAKKANPAISVQSQAVRDMKSVATSLGMTLEARQRLAINKVKEKEPVDPFEKLMTQ